MNSGSVVTGSERLIAMICVPVPTLVIGTSCLTGSKVSFCTCGVRLMLAEAENSKV